MRTAPNLKNKWNSPQTFKTEYYTPQLSRECTTEKIHYNEIKLPIPSIINQKEMASDYHNDFNYEISRVKALIHTELYTTLQVSTLEQNNDLQNSYIKPNPINQPQKTNKRLLSIQRIISMIYLIYGIVNMIVQFFVIIMFSVFDMNLIQYMIWVLLELILTALFIYISTKGYTMDNVTSSLLNKRIIIISILLCFLLCSLIISQHYKGIYNSIICEASSVPDISSDKQFEERIECVTFSFFFFSCIWKIIAQLIYLVLVFSIKLTLPVLENSE